MNTWLLVLRPPESLTEKLSAPASMEDIQTGKAYRNNLAEKSKSTAKCAGRGCGAHIYVPPSKMLPVMFCEKCLAKYERLHLRALKHAFIKK